MKQIKIGSRESPLAIAQTEEVIKALNPFWPDIEFAIVKIKTTGDKFQSQSLASIGGKASFIKELEEALLNEEVDFAVHSMKDMPAIIPDELDIIATPKGREVEDVFISFKYKSIEDLPHNAIFASCSPRRVAQVLKMRPDLNIVPLRGNILTRINKVKETNIDATILALAGIKRIEALDKKYYSILNPNNFGLDLVLKTNYR
jgi:hydroxymethylbilane synthase